MSTQIEVSKQFIINAIKKEPFLRGGSWKSTTEIYAKINGDDFVSRDDFAALYEKLDIIENKDCAVCAVGAVFRNVLEQSQRTESLVAAISAQINKEGNIRTTAIGDSVDEFEAFAKKWAKEKRYMSALSQYFEALYNFRIHCGYTNELSRHQIYRIKLRLIDFVKKYFPKKIILDIDGAEPAKDVKVVCS